MIVITFISTLVARLLQAVEFMRSGSGKWAVLVFNKIKSYKIFTVPCFIFAIVKITISLFRLFCSAVGGYLNSLGFSGIIVGGVDLLAIANTVFPVDEFIGLLISWVTLYGICASIRFARAAWAAIPFKAT